MIRELTLNLSQTTEYYVATSEERCRCMLSTGFSLAQELIAFNLKAYYLVSISQEIQEPDTIYSAL